MARGSLKLAELVTGRYALEEDQCGDRRDQIGRRAPQPDPVLTGDRPGLRGGCAWIAPARGLRAGSRRHYMPL